MVVAAWDPCLETGIDVIDAQHRALFGAIHELSDAFRFGQASAQAQECLAFLTHYTVEHFHTEERFMRSMGYPRLAEHRVEHAELLVKLRAIQDNQTKGYLVTAEVALFVSEWLRHHIHEEDMGYVRFTKAFRKR